MFKDNGRVTPAVPSELANLKGKHMKCLNCGEYTVFAKIKFADTKCSKCGTQMVDIEMSMARKTTG